jgi:uncharacterized protein (TIGR03435 family)
MLIKETPTEELLALGVFGRSSRLRERIEMLLERGRGFSPRVSRARFAGSVLGLLGFVVAGAFAPRMIAFAEDRPTFEAASVRPNKKGERGERRDFPAGGRFTATSASLKYLLKTAYRVDDFQILGGPGWLESDRFDIEAKATGNPPREQVLKMLESMLADRFKLALHWETRELPVYEMAVAKGGPKVKTQACVGQPGPDNPCGGFTVSLRGTLTGRVVPMAELAETLTTLLNRSVLDKTTLTGKYDFDLNWTPDGTTIRGPGDPDAPAPDPNGPSIFTAVREQLGLELKSTKGPVEVLVIDRVEKPDAN